MKFKYEVNPKSPISKDLPEDAQQKIEKIRLCIQMIKNKYGINKIEGRLDLELDEVELVLFNGTQGADTEKMDEANVKVIELLKLFDPKISKQKGAVSYWSNTIVKIAFEKLKLEKIDGIIESLSLLEEQPLKEKVVAMC